ncbi:MAG TPA: tRNA preQ1(34) S-adenosylmethionine ribosyltransferase-isomerase QueA [Steroidobacteraceae bacterium]|nr:tRNA preQ1(34) S-adenosylmethionine ribosyltransferase-isomerase QueA [Steroidobacteraceae bacterium]
MQRIHFDLPADLIAQRPATPRSASRLLALDGASGRLEDLAFRDLPGLLDKADLLVFNDTRVIPARVHGTKASGGRVEILLERVLGARTALVQARASKSLKPDATIHLPGAHSARLEGREGDLYRLQFSADVLEFFERHGEVPLPPYIDRAPDATDRERYQTVFARAPGAVAAPTAGLHFDAATFAELERRGVRHTFVTLHVGAGTFQPVRVQDIERHEMHPEYVEVGEGACAAINAARAAGGRIVAVGTTVVRSLETAAAARSAAGAGGLLPYRGMTRLFIRPGYGFRAIDAMVTNFHLPDSTLLLLCAAFVGSGALERAYEHAVAQRYRFYSYGDAMFMRPAAAALGRA